MSENFDFDKRKFYFAFYGICTDADEEFKEFDFVEDLDKTKSNAVFENTYSSIDGLIGVGLTAVGSFFIKYLNGFFNFNNHNFNFFNYNINRN